MASTSNDILPPHSTTLLRTKQLTDKVLLVIAIIFIFISIILNINAAYKLDYLSKYGKREKEECGNEFMELETPNYQIYNELSLKNNTKSLGKVIVNGFILLQVSWMIVITALSLNIGLDFWEMRDSLIRTNITIILIISILAFWSTYVGLYIVNIKGIIANIATANIAIDRKANIKKLYKLYLPTLLLIIPILVIAILNKSSFNTIYVIYGIIYILIIVLAIKFNSKSIDLVSGVDSTYQIIINDIQSNIISLIGTKTGETTLNTDMPQMPPTSVSDKLKYYLIHNIKSAEIVDGDNFILQDYQNNYWKYIIHQNGKELSEIYDIASNTQKTNIDTIRKNMRKLRNITPLQDLVSEYTTTTLYFAMVIILIILFGLYHLLFKHLNRPVTATIGISTITILLLIIGPLYGWLMRIVSKTN